MAVHVPLSLEAQMEARVDASIQQCIITSAWLIVPSQDIILIYTI